MSVPTSCSCRRLARTSFVLVASLVLAGCSTLGFYAQAVGGHFEIMRKRTPIERVLRRPELSVELRRQLELVQRVREFAIRELRLPDDGSYRAYAELGRDYVLWNVFAAPALSLDPIDSCVPVVGCIAYRSYFTHAGAQRHAERLRAAGHDVYVGGVAAYSTLGWFDDPVLNTMLTAGDEWLIQVVIHELAHERLYVRDDTAFNESFATMVADEGLQRWNRQHGGSDENHAKARARDEALVALLLKHRAALAQLYAGSAADEKKRRQKAARFAALLEEYAALKRAWGGYDGYDVWMKTDLNNAKLGSVATYHDYVAAFKAILRTEQDDIDDFYATVDRLALLAADARDRCLRQLMADDAAMPRACIEQTH